MTSTHAFSRNLAYFHEGLTTNDHRVGTGTSYLAGRVMRQAAVNADVPSDHSFELVARGLKATGARGPILEVTARIDGAEHRDERQTLTDDTPGCEVVVNWDMTPAVSAIMAVSGAFPARGGMEPYGKMMDDFLLSLRRVDDGDLGLDPRLSNRMAKALVDAGHLEETSSERFRLTPSGLRGYLDILHMQTEAGELHAKELQKRLEFLEGDMTPAGESPNWSFTTIPCFPESEPAFEETRERIEQLDPKAVIDMEFGSAPAMMI